MGPAIEISGGSAANTIVGVASFGAPRRLPRQGRAATSSATCSRHDIRSTGVTFSSPPAADGPDHRPLPHRRDARRAAHDEHVPRRVARCSAPTTSTPTWSPRRRSCTSRATSGTGPKPRRRTARPHGSRTRPGNEVSLTLSDSFCVDRHRAEWLRARRGRGRHPLRERSRDLRAVRMRVRRRDGSGAPRLPRRRADPLGATVRVIVAGDDDARGRRASGRHARRHDRRRRPLRGRLPVRLHAR